MLFIDTIFIIINIFSIIKFQGLVARQPYLCSLFSVLLGYNMLGTFVHSSCDIKINVNIVQNCCIKSAVKGIKLYTPEVS